MSKTNYVGIDYSGFSGANRDHKTGIRFGVIPANAVGQRWYDSGEPDYGDPHCPKCGNKLPSSDDHQTCDCGHTIKWCGDECYPDEPCGIAYEKDGYACNEDSSGDVWLFKSPYFTYAQFCSPCAPGACYLLNPLDGPQENNRAYCFGHDWFEEDRAPYPVYSVETGKEIVPHIETLPCPNCEGTGRDSLARIAEVRQCKPEDIDVAQLHVENYQEGTFDCFRCYGKGTIQETTYVEKD